MFTLSFSVIPHIFSRKKFIQDLFLKYIGTIIPIFRVSFNKRPSIDITNIRFTIGPQKIKSTYFLLKLLHNFITYELFIRRENNRVSYLLPLLISLDHTVQGWWPSCLRIHVIRTDCVDLYIKSICGQKLLVYVITIFTDLIEVLEQTRLIFYFPE